MLKKTANIYSQNLIKIKKKQTNLNSTFDLQRIKLQTLVDHLYVIFQHQNQTKLNKTKGKIKNNKQSKVGR